MTRRICIRDRHCGMSELTLWFYWEGDTHYRVLHLFAALQYLESVFSDAFCKRAHAVTGKTEAISGVISKGISSFA